MQQKWWGNSCGTFLFNPKYAWKSAIMLPSSPLTAGLLKKRMRANELLTNWESQSPLLCTVYRKSLQSQSEAWIEWHDDVRSAACGLFSRANEFFRRIKRKRNVELPTTKKPIHCVDGDMMKKFFVSFYKRNGNDNFHTFTSFIPGMFNMMSL